MRTRPKILIVDDDPLTVRVFTRILQTEGYDVSSALEAKAGLKLAVSGGFQVIILDNRFSDSDTLGTSVIPAFAAAASAGVIMISGYTDEDMVKDAKLLGCREFLAKPLEPSELLQAVASVLGRTA